MLRAYGSSGSPTGVMVPGGVKLSVLTFLGELGRLSWLFESRPAKYCDRDLVAWDARLEDSPEVSLFLEDNRSVDVGREVGAL